MTDRGHRNKTWIRIQELSRKVFEFDDLPASWVDRYVVRAHIGTSQGTESVVGQRTDTTRRIPVSIRWLPEVTESMRVVIDDETQTHKRILSIASVDNVGERNRDLELDCTELKQ